MSDIIADSSALVAVIVEDDSTHQAAMAAAQQVMNRNRPIIVPMEVFAETINLLGKKLSNRVAIQAAEYLLESPSFQVTPSNLQMLTLTTQRLRRLKASVSFIDALVMTWADQRKTREIFGFDQAFKQNGYTTPLNAD